MNHNEAITLIVRDLKGQLVPAGLLLDELARNDLIRVLTGYRPGIFYYPHKHEPSLRVIDKWLSDSLLGKKAAASPIVNIPWLKNASKNSTIIQEVLTSMEKNGNLVERYLGKERLIRYTEDPNFEKKSSAVVDDQLALISNHFIESSFPDFKRKVLKIIAADSQIQALKEQIIEKDVQKFQLQKVIDKWQTTTKRPKTPPLSKNKSKLKSLRAQKLAIHKGKKLLREKLDARAQEITEQYKKDTLELLTNSQVMKL